MFGKKKKRLEISAPSNFEHRVHTGFDPREQKFTGLPQQWQSLLADTANRPKPMVDPSYITPIQLAPMKVECEWKEANKPEHWGKITIFSPFLHLYDCHSSFLSLFVHFGFLPNPHSLCLHSLIYVLIHSFRMIPALFWNSYFCFSICVFLRYLLSFTSVSLVAHHSTLLHSVVCFLKQNFKFSSAIWSLYIKNCPSILNYNHIIVYNTALNLH